MGARQSQEAKDAQVLIEDGVPVYKACERTGINHTTIYKSEWWRNRKASKAAQTKGGDAK